MSNASCDIGLMGLAVMGQNLVLNMNDHGYKVAVFNRTVSKVDDFLKNEAAGTSRPMEVNYENAVRFTATSVTYSHFDFPLADYPRALPASQYEGSMSLWSALGGSDGPEHAIITVEQAQALALGVCARVEANTSR